MWIDNSKRKPNKAGQYNCLVDVDGLGNLIETRGEVFTGTTWSYAESNNHNIKYWNSGSKLIHPLLEKEQRFDFFESKLNNTEIEEL